MKKQTVITIEMEGEIPEHKLDELLEEISGRAASFSDGRIITRHKVDTFKLEMSQNNGRVLVEIIKNQVNIEAVFEFCVENSTLVLRNLMEDDEDGENFTAYQNIQDTDEPHRVALGMPFHPNKKDQLSQLLNDCHLEEEFCSSFGVLLLRLVTERCLKQQRYHE